jgi:hypothetical protein
MWVSCRPMQRLARVRGQGRGPAIAWMGERRVCRHKGGSAEAGTGGGGTGCVQQCTRGGRGSVVDVGRKGYAERARRDGRAEQGAVARWVWVWVCDVHGAGMGRHGARTLGSGHVDASGDTGRGPAWYGKCGETGRGRGGSVVTGRDTHAEERHGRGPAWGETGRDRRHTAREHSSGVGMGRNACTELRQQRGGTGRVWWRGHGRG